VAAVQQSGIAASIECCHRAVERGDGRLQSGGPRFVLQSFDRHAVPPVPTGVKIVTHYAAADRGSAARVTVKRSLRRKEESRVIDYRGAPIAVESSGRAGARKARPAWISTRIVVVQYRG